ncbi:MAG TPA: hypothetical protein VG206_14975 [Terriglobia bacterium]|nr:hypothetical protein [Terriglobia bacterium]
MKNRRHTDLRTALAAGVALIMCRVNNWIEAQRRRTSETSVPRPPRHTHYLLSAFAVLLLCAGIGLPARAQAFRPAGVSNTANRDLIVRAPQPRPKPVPGKASSPSRQPKLGLSSLPGPAQPAVSATLGRDDAGYRVRTLGGTLSAENPAQALKADFTRHGMEVRAGGASWSLALAGYGYGDHLEGVPEATPQSQANRVEYHRGPAVEWYLNGPLGLEQGFTLTEPPDRKSSPNQGEPLTIALALGGDLRASADSSAKSPDGAGAEGLTLSDRHGQAVLRYTGLAAYDASGQKLVREGRVTAAGGGREGALSGGG